VLRSLGSFIWLLLQPKAVLAASILALQSQLAVCKHRIDAGKAPRPRFNQAFSILWVSISPHPRRRRPKIGRDQRGVEDCSQSSSLECYPAWESLTSKDLKMVEHSRDNSNYNFTLNPKQRISCRF